MTYQLLSAENSTVILYSRYNKILAGTCVAILLLFAVSYKSDTYSDYSSNDLNQLPSSFDGLQACPRINLNEENELQAPTTLDPLDPAFEYTFKVRSNIEKLLSEDYNSNKVKPFQTIYEHFKTTPLFKIAAIENPKAMSTVMMNIMCYLYDEEGFTLKNNNIANTWWSDSACSFRNAPETYRDLLKNLPYGINYIGVIRDPFKRFISAYLNKCVVETRKDIINSCFNCTSADEPNCIIERMYHAFTTKEFPTTVDTRQDHYYEMYHFAPQTWICRMKDIYKQTAFIRYGDSGVEKARMYQGVLATLKAYGVPQRKVDYIKKSFDVETLTWHATKKMDEKDKLIENILGNETLYNMLMDVYARDYELFEFTPPKMLNSAGKK